MARTRLNRVVNSYWYSLAMAVFVWDKIWRGHRYAWRARRRSSARLKANMLSRSGLDLAETDAVLDVGCGSGDLLRELIGTTPDHVQFCGCDRSHSAVQRASSTVEEFASRVSLVYGNAESLPYANGQFSVVLMIGVLEHLRDPLPAIQEAHRVLQPGGEVYIVTSNRYTVMYQLRLLRQYSGCWPYGYQRNMTPTQARDLLGQHFTVDDHSVCQTGPYHLLAAIADRLVAVMVKNWGRYIILRGIKEK